MGYGVKSHVLKGCDIINFIKRISNRNWFYIIVIAFLILFICLKIVDLNKDTSSLSFEKEVFYEKESVEPTKPTILDKINIAEKENTFTSYFKLIFPFIFILLGFYLCIKLSIKFFLIMTGEGDI